MMDAKLPKSMERAPRFFAVVIAASTLCALPHLLAFPTDAYLSEDKSLEVPGLTNLEEVGYAVALDGGTAAVSAPAEDDYYGAVYVFNLEGGTWGEPERIIPAERELEAYFGASVILRGDTMIVGAPGVRDTVLGAVFVLERGPEGWVEVQKLRPDNLTSFDRFGQSVALDGTTLLVGSHGGVGRAYVYRHNGAEWIKEEELHFPENSGHASLGRKVALVGDTAFLAEEQTNKVHFFEYAEGAWNYAGELTPESASDSFQRFGSSLVARGNRVLVGASSEKAAYLFERSDGEWTQLRLQSPESWSDLFGFVVGVSDDHLLVGAAASGTLYGYSLAGDLEWTLAHDYNRPSGILTLDGGDVWISAIAANGHTALLGLQGTLTDGDFAEARFVEIDPASPAHIDAMVRGRLYASHGEDEGAFDREEAAFRYADKLFAEDEGTVRPRYDVIGDYFGQAERNRIVEAMDSLRTALAEYPEDGTLGTLLLDLLYDSAVAESVVSEDTLGLAAKARFGPPIADPAPDGGFVIDNEIVLLREAFDQAAKTTSGYFEAFAAEPPGAAVNIFRTLVPLRALMPAVYSTDQGESEAVDDDASPLLAGNKDLVFLFERLRERGRIATELGRLLLARDEPGDREQVANLVLETQRALFLEGGFLSALTPEMNTPESEANLETARAGWAETIANLGNLQQILDGDANVLAFDDNFLMFVQAFPGQSGDVFDSYDALQMWLDPESGETNPLKVAVESRDEAIDNYITFRESQDAIEAQFVSSSITYEDRLRDIVGVFPEDPEYTDNPTAHPGSELDQQYQSIRVAELRIERNRAEISNLHEAIRIEAERAGSITNAIIDFGNRQAKLTRIIGHIEAAQAFSDSMAQALSIEKLTTGRFIGVAANAVIQGAGQEAKGQLNAKKEELAALEQATLEGINSAAAIKTMLLQMNVFSIDSQEAAVLLTQEVNRMAALYREKADLERKLAERDASLARRYFADPVHRLRSQTSMIQANLSFEEARKWLFFMVRALDYKWNTDWSTDYLGRTWNARTILRLRNADDLSSGSPFIPFFRERSVAATGWQMAIETRGNGEELLNIDEIDDILVYFCHRAIPRQ